MSTITTAFLGTLTFVCFLLALKLLASVVPRILPRLPTTMPSGNLWMVLMIILVVGLLFWRFEIDLALGLSVLAILAVLGLFQKGGGLGKVAVAIVALSLLTLGTQAPTILRKLQAWSTTTVLNGPSWGSGSTATSTSGGRTIPVRWTKANPDGSVPARTESLKLVTVKGVDYFAPMGRDTLYKLMKSHEGGWVPYLGGSAYELKLVALRDISVEEQAQLFFTTRQK